MADYMVTDSELTGIANAIRTKGGTSSQIEFPTGFVNAINAIDGGSGSSFLDEIIQVDSHIAVNSTTNEIIIPAKNNGCYLLVMYPLITPQDAIDSNTYIFKAGQFIVTGSAKNIYNGQTYLYNSSGASDYWGLAASYTDATKTQISIKGNSSGAVNFLADHDLYIIAVKWN